MQPDSSGWRIRASKKDVLSLEAGDIVYETYVVDEKLYAHINRSIRVYSIDDDATDKLLEEYSFEYDFKFFNSQFNNVFYLIDTTNERNYVLQFTDRVTSIVDDTGDTDVSTELIMHTIDSNTKDTIWSGLALHADTTEDSSTWDDSVNKYLVTYTGEKIALMTQYEQVADTFRYVIVASDGTDTYVYETAWDDPKPEYWESRYKITGSDIFDSASTAKYMDIKNDYAIEAEYINSGLNGVVAKSQKGMIEFSGYIYLITSNGWLYFGNNSEGFIIKHKRTAFDSIISHNGSVYVAGGKNLWKLTENGLSTETTTSYDINDIVSFDGDIYISQQLSYILKWDGVSLTEVSTNSGGGVFCVFDNSLYMAYDGSGPFGPSVKEYGGGTTWNSTGSIGSSWFSSNKPVTALIEHDSKLVIGFYDLYVGNTGYVYEYDGSSWSQVGGTITGILHCLVEHKDQLYAGIENSADGELYLYNAGWSKILDEGSGDDVGKAIYSMVSVDDILYISGITSGAIGYISTYSGIYNDTYEIWYQGADHIDYIAVDETAGTATETQFASNTITGGKSCKVMQFVYPDAVVSYLLHVDSGDLIDIYVIDLEGNTTYIASNLEALGVWTSGNPSYPNINSSYDLTTYIGMGKSINEYYERNDSGQRAVTISAMTNNRFVLIDFYLDSADEATEELEWSFQDEGAVITDSNYTQSAQTIVVSPIKTSYADDSRVNYFYVVNGAKVDRFKITGNVMSNDDLGAKEFFYNYEFSRYVDPAGNILALSIGNPKGYVLTEINKSVKVPVRPYFTADSDDSLTEDGIEEDFELHQTFELQVANSTQKFRTRIQAGEGSQVLINDDGDSYNWKYWMFYLIPRGLLDYGNATTATEDYKLGVNVVKGIEGTDQYESYFWLKDAITTQQEDVRLPETFYDPQIGIENIQIGTSDLWTYIVNDKIFYRKEQWMDTNSATVTTADDGSYYSTATISGVDNPLFRVGDYLSVIADSEVATVTADSAVISDIADTSNIVVGSRVTGTGIPAGAVVVSIVTNTSVTLDQDAITTGTPTVYFWDVKEILEILDETAGEYKLSGTSLGWSSDSFEWLPKTAPRDRFILGNTDPQFESDRMFIQDLIDRPDELTVALDYNRKSGYYSYGYLFMNRYNRFNFGAEPTGIYQVDQGSAVIATENSIYTMTGDSVDTLTTNLLTQNLGLEKDNYQAIVSDGQRAFIHNQHGLFMIAPTEDGLVKKDIWKEIQDYLYYQDSGNYLGLDVNRNLLYVPLDEDQIDELKLVTASGDYQDVTEGETETLWTAYFGVYDYINDAWRMYAYERTEGSSWTPVFGFINDYLILRVDDTLIIPEYLKSEGSENPLCRFRTKMMTMGSSFERKQLYESYNQFELHNSYGIDYLRNRLIVNDGEADVAYKYGDFGQTTYTDCDEVYDQSANSNFDTAEGIQTAHLPYERFEFRRIEYMIEFGRMADSNYSHVGLEEVTFYVIQKKKKVKGISS